MKKAQYMSKGMTARRNVNSFKVLFSILFASFFVVITFVTSLQFSTVSATEEEDVKKASPLSDPIRWSSCLWGDYALPDLAYKITFTDYVPYNLFSKSAISSHVSRVDVLYNWMIDLSGGALGGSTGFKKTNEEILGTTLTAPKTPEEIAYEESLTFNSGPKVSVYDRFGLAGLNWTGYKGEFHSVLVRTCDGLQVDEVMNGRFYEGRKTPPTSYFFRNKSDDPRTSIIGSFPNDVGHSFGLVVANGIFGITKLLVALTITVVNLSFTNLVELFGIDTILVGSNGASGLVGSLFTNVFQTFIVIAMVITGFYMLYQGIVKRAYRNAMTALARSVGVFIAAIIIFSNPAWFIALPNNIAVVAQSVVISALGGGIAGGHGLCDSDISSKTNQITTQAGTLDNTPEQASSILQEAGTNIRSALGCQFWYTFAFRPWVDGQWGTTYEKLWAEDTTLPSGSKNTFLGNQNGEWVGDAAVPLGDGTFINNWAVFNLSTNTNAHAPLGKEGERSLYTTNVANDWWRTVDAISNYKTTPIDMSSAPVTVEGEITEETPAPDIETLPYWDRWTSSESTFGKIGIALNSILVGIIGVIGPLFFAMLSSILAIEVALLMAVSPLMFLFGAWAGRGWEIFKGWGELVINTTLQRIVVGILMSVSIVMTMSAISVLELGGGGNWFKGIVLLLLSAMLLIKSRKKIIDAMASIRFASVDMGAARDRLKSKLGGIAKTTGGIARGATVGAAGAAAAKKRGITTATIGRGAWEGMKTEAKYRAYSSNSAFARGALTQYEATRVASGKDFEDDVDGKDANLVYCKMCRIPISKDRNIDGTGGEAMRDNDGNFYCYECWTRGDAPENVTYVDFSSENKSRNKEPLRDEVKESVIDLSDLEKAYETATSSAARAAILNDATTKIGEALSKAAEDTSPDLDVVLATPPFLSSYIDVVAMKEAVRKLAKDPEDTTLMDQIADAYGTAINRHSEAVSGTSARTSDELSQDIKAAYAAAEKKRTAQ